MCYMLVETGHACYEICCLLRARLPLGGAFAVGQVRLPLGGAFAVEPMRLLLDKREQGSRRRLISCMKCLPK